MSSAAFLVPSVLVALSALVVQCIIGIVGFIMMAKSARVERASKRVAYAVALMDLTSALPVSDGQKIVLKRSIVDKLVLPDLPDDVREVITRSLGT